MAESPTRCQHEPDPASLQPADGAGRSCGTDWIIDVWCIKCGRSGSLQIDPQDLNFDDDPVLVIKELS